MTVEQKTGQSDPTNSLPLRWTVSFTEPVTGLDATDLTRGGTATGGTVTVTGSDASYEISLDGNPTNGTVSFSIDADRAQDAAGNGNTASTSTDNTIAYDTVAPFVKLVQKAGQADPTNSLPIRFTVLFGEPVADFDASDVSLGGTAGGGSVAVTGSGKAYEIAVSDLSGDGTVTASVGAGKAHDAAGNANPPSAKRGQLGDLRRDRAVGDRGAEGRSGRPDEGAADAVDSDLQRAGGRVRRGRSDPQRDLDRRHRRRHRLRVRATRSRSRARRRTAKSASRSARTGRRTRRATGTPRPRAPTTRSLRRRLRRPRPSLSARPLRTERTRPPRHITLSASDATSGVASTLDAIDGGSAEADGGAVTVPEGEHTLGYWSIDGLGNVEATQTASVKVDTVAPVDALSLAAPPFGAFLAPDNILFFKGQGGSFTLVDAPTDVTSGIASATFPAAGTIGWTGSGRHGLEPAVLRLLQVDPDRLRP